MTGLTMELLHSAGTLLAFRPIRGQNAPSTDFSFTYTGRRRADGDLRKVCPVKLHTAKWWQFSDPVHFLAQRDSGSGRGFYSPGFHGRLSG